VETTASPNLHIDSRTLEGTAEQPIGVGVGLQWMGRGRDHACPARSTPGPLETPLFWFCYDRNDYEALHPDLRAHHDVRIVVAKALIEELTSNRTGDHLRLPRPRPWSRCVCAHGALDFPRQTTCRFGGLSARAAAGGERDRPGAAEPG
jgi:hypothetical protein